LTGCLISSRPRCLLTEYPAGRWPALLTAQSAMVADQPSFVGKRRCAVTLAGCATGADVSGYGGQENYGCRPPCWFADESSTPSQPVGVTRHQMHWSREGREHLVYPGLLRVIDRVYGLRSVREWLAGAVPLGPLPSWHATRHERQLDQQTVHPPHTTRVPRSVGW
jgi:hypothetical protein